jgi:hypothetical protein
MENYWTPALFVSAYNQIPGKKKRESHQMPRLFQLLLTTDSKL